ncbi:hypothetical protein [Rhodococcus sp. NPDC058481]|uniref:hypothetical protein n=1 Tax=unclassified Rhodococcus (in: high G+C Gram-positive bacteria) TaxID=192944 RepID=UPI00364E6414
MFALVAFAVFNLLSLFGAYYCASRSYRRHRRAGRAVVAGFGGLFIVPLLLMLCVAVARPRPVNTYR